jgi:hypothetical protein
MGDLQTRVENVHTRRDELTKRAFTRSAGVPNSRETVATVQFDRPHAIRTAPTDIGLMAYEEKTTDGTADDSEIFSLSHEPVESGVTDTPLVLYEEGVGRVFPDSVDYGANEFTYTSGGTNNTLGVFYASGRQAQVLVQKRAPNGVKETLWTGDLGLLHLRDHAKDPVTINLTDSYWQALVPSDWHLEVVVNAPYTVRWAKDVDGDGTDETATNALLNIPVRKARDTIDGLSTAVRTDAARR